MSTPMAQPAVREPGRRRPPVAAVRRFLGKCVKTVVLEKAAWDRRQPVDPNLVLYESFGGNGMLCHPEALFRGLLDDPDQHHLTHVWALTGRRGRAAVTAEFADNPRVRFVERGSMAYFTALSQAGLLVNNATFPVEFAKRPEQVYLNTWHGTPLKRMGYDEQNGPIGARNVLRNFLMADYLLSSSDYMTQVMYEHAYRLVNVAPGRVLQVGEPRTDRQRLDDAGRRRVRERLRGAGLDLRDGDKVVLYAPTWRGSSFHAPVEDAALADRLAELTERLGPGYQVLAKVHQQVYERTRSGSRRLRDRLVPNDVPTNEVLGVADVLVTDYSSVFFDFLSTGRPVLFFTPDLSEYDDSRGLYLSQEELPGPRLETVAELARAVADLGSGGAGDALVTHEAAYANARARFAPHNDGGATQRVLDIVVRGRRGAPGDQPIRRDGRHRLLVYLGGMKPNGITSSALNLLRNLDHQRYDVSVLFQNSEIAERRELIAAIDPHARLVVRMSGMAVSKWHRRRRNRLHTVGAGIGSENLAIMDALLLTEWRRVAGYAELDTVVDFSGYSPFWAFLLSVAPARTHAIWLHNDLLADADRLVDGKRPHHDHLTAVFSSYPRFDKLVSVSASLRDINASNLAGYAPPNTFVAARNAIDSDRIRARAYGVPAEVEAWPGDEVLRSLGHSPTLDDIEVEVERRGLGDVRAELIRRIAITTVAPRLPGVCTFVTVGRLSPEKNHRRLLDAFALVHKREPATRLVIIGGGPLELELQQQAESLGLADQVVLAGQQSNPWAVMTQCDVFVLSSDYEGQPMVILEALTLGLPVVTTAFGSVASALPSGAGLVVARDVDALAAGMLAALAGEVPSGRFDPATYNNEVMAEFDAAIGNPADAGQAPLRHAGQAAGPGVSRGQGPDLPR